MKTLGRLYGKSRLKILSGKASLWKDGHKWRSWLCGRERERFILTPEGRVPGWKLGEGSFVQAMQLCRDPSLAGHKLQLFICNFAATHFSSSIFPKPWKPVVVYVNRNVRFSPSRDLWKIVDALLLCHILCALFGEGILLSEDGQHLMALFSNHIWDWKLCMNGISFLFPPCSCGGGGNLLIALSFPICRTGIKPPFSSWGH